VRATENECATDAAPPASALTELPTPLVRALLAARPLSAQDREEVRRVAESAAIDWRGVARTVDASGVGPLALTRMHELGLAGHLDPQTSREWEADRLHAQLQCVLQREDALRVTRALTEAGVRHAFLKGLALREWLYEPLWVRAGSDSDILVDLQDVETTRSVLLSLGFVQASRDKDFTNFRPATPLEIWITESQHYELAQFARDFRLRNPPEWLFSPDYKRQAPSAFEMLPDGPVLHSVIDVHWLLHFLFEGERPLDRVEWLETSTGDAELPTLPLEWHIFFTAFKLYFEALDRPGWGLHLLADLAALLQVRPPDDVDWEWLDSRVELHEMEAAFFYTLSAAERVAGQALVPDEFLRRWAAIEPRDSDDTRPNLDFGDFLPHVLGRRLPGSFLAPVR